MKDMDRGTVEKTQETIVIGILGVFVLALAAALIFIVYDSMPTSIYIICGSVLVWCLIYKFHEWRNR